MGKLTILKKTYTHCSRKQYIISIETGIPFVAINLGFFKEFASMGQGITSKIDPAAFSKAIMKIDANYEFFTRNAEEFSPKLKWKFIAQQHAAIYYSAAVEKGTQKI